MNSANMNMEVNSYPAQPPEENPVLANTLIAALQITQLRCAQAPDAKKLWHNQCVFCHYICSHLLHNIKS